MGNLFRGKIVLNTSLLTPKQQVLPQDCQLFLQGEKVSTAQKKDVYLYTEEKAEVVAAVWGTAFVQFLTMLAILHQDDLKNRIHSSSSFYHPGAIHSFLHTIWVQISQCGKKLNKFCPPNSSDDLCLILCINSSSMVHCKKMLCKRNG